MAISDDLIPVLKKLRLSGILQTLDLRTKEAVEGDLSHTEFLFRLCSDEVERREAKQLDLRLRRASFDSAKRLEDFEWSFNPQVPKAKIVDLATCHFVEKKENVLLVGPTGVGKSHLAQAIGERACRAGHTVCSTSAHRMLGQLRASRADGSHDKRLLRFTAPDLLIVDDLGLRPLEGDEPIDLYEIIRARYERGSMIVTSNRAIEEWYPLFLDDLMASAAMDRLLHHAHLVVMEGHSTETRPAPGAEPRGPAWPNPRATFPAGTARSSRCLARRSADPSRTANPSWSGRARLPRRDPPATIPRNPDQYTPPCTRGRAWPFPFLPIPLDQSLRSWSTDRPIPIPVSTEPGKVQYRLSVSSFLGRPASSKN